MDTLGKGTTQHLVLFDWQGHAMHRSHGSLNDHQVSQHDWFEVAPAQPEVGAVYKPRRVQPCTPQGRHCGSEWSSRRTIAETESTTPTVTHIVTGIAAVTDDGSTYRVWN